VINCDKDTMEVKLKNCNVVDGNSSGEDTNNSCVKEDTKPVSPEEEVSLRKEISEARHKRMIRAPVRLNL